MATDYEITQVNEQMFFIADDCVVTFSNHLFGVPLYGWYVIIIERFEVGDIQGLLMTFPVEFLGPLGSYEEAEICARSYMDDTPMNSQPG